MIFDRPEQRNRVLSALFDDYEGSPFSIRFWDGWQWTSIPGSEPAYTIVLHNAKALHTFMASPNEIDLAEAFIHGDLDVEGDIFSVFSMVEQVLSRPEKQRERIAAKLAQTAFRVRQWVAHGPRHSKAKDRAAIAYHYDQPVEFFRPWLGESLAYSCAYFRDSSDSLDAAQEHKLALVCQKLRLRPRERFLDIGCGSGSLPLYAAVRHGASALGVTVSRRQYDEASRRIARSNLGNRCGIVLCDYRELGSAARAFDKIASVGMFEHVGLDNLRRYFRTARGWLRPGGVFLNHGIARAYHSPPRKNSFIDRYVFPDGQLVTLSETIKAAEAEGLEIRDVENLREHYELTLRSWVAGLRANASELLRHLSQETYRIWLLYVAGSAAAFHSGDIAVYQVLLSRPDKGLSHLPLTREDWYAGSEVGERQEV
jgi:cyclopropane-fatty-acyl-phospholipid synthase